MELRLQVRFYTDEYSWLCFRHAIREALEGRDVRIEIDDYDVEYYMGPTSCIKCDEKTGNEL